MPNFEIALRIKPPIEISRIEAKIFEWENLSLQQKKIVSNLYKEHFASVSKMEKFIEEIIPYLNLPPDSFKNEVFKIYHKYIFCGESANINVAVNTFGFSLTKYILREVISRDYFDYFNQDATLVDNFLANISLGVKDELLDFISIKGSPSILWVTWSPTSDDPFDFMKNFKREEIFNALALSNYYRDTPIFIFKISRNKLFSKSVLIRPTVFDANEYAPFLPADEGFNDHGFTDPYNDPSFLVNSLPLFSDKRPEAVAEGGDITYADIFFAKEL